jgi:hypothetical protein
VDGGLGIAVSGTGEGIEGAGLAGIGGVEGRVAADCASAVTGCLFDRSSEGSKGFGLIAGFGISGAGTLPLVTGGISKADL